MTETNDVLPPSLRSLSHRVVKADSNGVGYDILVWTPTGYEEGQQSYPLLIHIFSSGIRELWGSGMTMADMMEQAMAG